MLASLPESNTPWERITYVGSVPSGDKFPLQLSFLHWNNFLFMFSAWESSSLFLEEVAGSSSLCWRVATGRELVEEWISNTTTGGSLATEVGLLHHPEATHHLFHVIEDVTPWSVGQFPIMFSNMRRPPRYWLGRDGRSLAFVKPWNMRMPPYPCDGLPHRSWYVTEKKKNMTLWLEYSC